ncbi:MAG TPA: hypothetical protein VIL09_19445 [Microvirga sp.]|jgi:hypothetical protein
MKRLVLVAAALAALAAAAPASAQSLQDGPGGSMYRDFGNDGPPRRYERQFQEREYYAPRQRRDYYSERYDDRPRRGGYSERYDDRPRRGAYRQTRAGSVCVTARGNCDTGAVLPLNTPCGCNIPGFGQKRGAIGF